ncbi:MAG: hypothetical protein J1E65_07150 [Lachnospiraceae bacterium]|nr:hypothetical protein [Lachnospiraceae bacterium]
MLYGSVLIMFVLLAIISNKKLTGSESRGLKKRGIEGCFYQMAELLYEWWPFGHRRNSMVSEYLARLHPGQAPPLLRHKHEVERIKLCLIVLFSGNMIALFLWISGSSGSRLVDGMYLTRNRQGEGSREFTLVAKSSSGEEVKAHLTVQSLGYSEKEQQDLYEEMLMELEKTVLGENSSWDDIWKPLVLPEKLEPYPFTLSWRSSNPLFLTLGGKVASWEDVEELPEHTALVELTVWVSGNDFEREYCFYARVCPKPKEKTFSEAVTDVLEKLERETTGKEKLLLPEEIEGEKVVWTLQRENQSSAIFLLGIVGAVILFLLQGREPERALAKKQHLMEREYPTIISKLTLYLGAGLNTKSAWERIAESMKEKDPNPIYGEMLLTCREMESGITEAEAYARFGKRIRQQCYVRFTTLLVQNLKKGNTALLLQLRQEALTAMEEHAALIKRAGEESATKLLLPMVMLMGMVMILIMVPAFMGM